MKPFPWKFGHHRERAVDPVPLETYSTELDHNGRKYPITVNFQVARCEKCSSIILDDTAHRRLSDALRSAAGLLQSAEIRAGREALGLTQKELANDLQIAETTLSRWETGAQIPQRSLDKLLRGFFGVEELRRFLGVPDLAPGAPAPTGVALVR